MYKCFIMYPKIFLIRDSCFKGCGGKTHVPELVVHFHDILEVLILFFDAACASSLSRDMSFNQSCC